MPYLILFVMYNEFYIIELPLQKIFKFFFILFINIFILYKIIIFIVLIIKKIKIKNEKKK